MFKEGGRSSSRRLSAGRWLTEVSAADALGCHPRLRSAIHLLLLIYSPQHLLELTAPRDHLCKVHCILRWIELVSHLVRSKGICPSHLQHLILTLRL